MISKLIIKAFLRTAACFTMSIVLYSIVALVEGFTIEPVTILLFTAMFVLIGILVFIRLLFDTTKWAKSKPAVVKNFMFIPAFYAVAVLMLKLILGGLDLSSFLYMSGGFVTVFLLMQTISYFIAKGKTDEMNDALQNFKKEHWGDEEG